MQGSHHRTATYAFLAFAVFLIVLSLVYAWGFGPVWKEAQEEQFLVSPKESVHQVAAELHEKGFVRSPWIFEIAFIRASEGKGIRPGGYKISKEMDAWTIAKQLVAPPYFAWVTIPIGVRTEQIEEILATELRWGETQRSEWRAAIASSTMYTEGMYLPGPYLVLAGDPPALIAKRLEDHFAQAFAPYAAEAGRQKRSWKEILTIASLIQRETGKASEMPIIAGVIERRLESGMPLAIDATLQYMEGSGANGWWPKPSKAATYPDSPFNTYKRTGLPPHPISNASASAIEAALNPKETSCLFYIHDAHGQIHCSSTYSGHLANIRKYLQ